MYILLDSYKRELISQRFAIAQPITPQKQNLIVRLNEINHGLTMR